MAKTSFAFAAAAALFVFATQAQAAPIVIDWEDSDGQNNFDNDTITDFTAFTANTLTGVADLDDPAAYYTRYLGDLADTDPPILGPVTFFLDIKLDGVWTNIWSDAVFADGTYQSHDLTEKINAPITFDEGLVSAIRFTSVPDTGWPDNYQKFDGLQLTFDSIPEPAPVPEPASMALMTVGGLGLVGGAIRRRRNRKVAAA